MDEYMEGKQADDLWKAFGTELISDRPKKETGGQRVAPHIIGELKRIYKDKEEEARRQEASCRAKAARRTNKLELDDFLTKGQCIFSTNGKYKVIFQNDGNFVVYEYREGVPIWASDTWGKRNADKVIMQGDCNLVMYNTKGTALWKSNTHMPNCQACCLTMQDDGNVVIYRDNKEIWSGKKK
ncbi:B-type lectin plumieribetin-like isoform X1 [Acipenser ruthenus]|uniref:B-type lectin plumieribetin-like isoform X1 n=1 Tax=Acipenser ruthenus TaxID=7906 RepID=UPI00145BB89C|nr:B-type lectin plumieribetin-like isoform X1 [Acipenser ruthenus]